MESGEVNSSEPLSGPWLADYLDARCPQLMAAGMSYDEFWFGDTARVHAYEQAQRIRDDHQNGMMLVQAAYIHRVLYAYREVIIQSQNAKIHPLDMEPFPLTPEQMEELEKQHEAKAREKMINALMRK